MTPADLVPDSDKHCKHKLEHWSGQPQPLCLTHTRALKHALARTHMDTHAHKHTHAHTDTYTRTHTTHTHTLTDNHINTGGEPKLP